MGEPAIVERIGRKAAKVGARDCAPTPRYRFVPGGLDALGPVVGVIYRDQGRYAQANPVLMRSLA